MSEIKAVIIGCQGEALTADEKKLFTEHNPLGFILFQRNCRTKEQVKELVDEMRDAVGREDAPVLIDQEGGSVARLKAPEWREFPPARKFGDLARKDAAAAEEAARLNAVLMATEMAGLGITVDCAPVVDVPSIDCHGFLADSRTFSRDPAIVNALGRAVCEGLLEGGVTPVLKHIPGHGRARVDSHKELPQVNATRDELEQNDYAPFREISRLPWGEGVWAMSAHVLYTALDAEQPASVSPGITDEIIRREIGFKGFLVADDISMEALDGTLAERIQATLNGCADATLHCNGRFPEMKDALEAARTMTEGGLERFTESEKIRKNRQKDDIDTALVEKRIAQLLQERNVA